MKKLLLLLVAALPFLSYGQRIEAGLNGGIGLNSVPGGNNGVTDFKRNPSFVASAKGLVNLTDNWQIGLGIDMQKISVDANGGTFRFGNPGIPVYVILNRKFHGFYAGLIAGIMMPNTEYTEEKINGPISLFPVEYDGKNGYTAGLHAGYTIYLTKKIGVNAELAGRYASTDYIAPSSQRRLNNDYFYYQGTVGLRYRLF